jgi:hypothetical protein
MCSRFAADAQEIKQSTVCNGWSLQLLLMLMLLLLLLLLLLWRLCPADARSSTRGRR